MPEPSHRTCRVVLCDDTAGIRALLRARLSSHPGVVVVGEAGNGREAIALAGELRPHLMLLDISMPVMDGIEALPQILRASPSTAVLMLSGFSAPEVKQRALDAGAVAYLDKGIDLDEIVAAVQRHCQDGTTR